MHEEICVKNDLSVAGFEDAAALLLIHALEHERHRLERAGRVFKYANITVCERCLHEHVLDYMGLVLKRADGHYSCELCGDNGGFWLFEVFLVFSMKRRLEHVHESNWRGLMRHG